jgi:predicted dehydrogenase
MLNLAMIGGGPGAFIGAVHRLALAMDGEARLVAGAFSSSPERSRDMGRVLGLNPLRVHGDVAALIASEVALGQGRIDAAVIATPNHLHAPAAIALLDAGVPVICDKPLAATLEQARHVEAAVRRTGVPLAVTYNYSGYPLIREARELVRGGALGEIRRIVAEYHQGWLATPLESTGQKQAAWRTDPAQAGAGALGDIGSHAEHLVRFVSGLEIESLCAEVSTFVPGRRVDDDAAVLVRFAQGSQRTQARGIISASQVCIGRENDLSLRIFGDRGTLAWRQEDPNTLEFTPLGDMPRRITRGSTSTASASAATRLPPGHPEGFYEAFANVYRSAFDLIRCWKAGRPCGPSGALAPTAEDGLRGLRFIDAALRSRGSWITIESEGGARS